MKTTKLIMVIILLFSIGTMFGQYIQVVFKDQSNPNQTRNLVMSEATALNFSYVNNQPVDQRWVVQLYKDGGDGIINP